MNIIESDELSKHGTKWFFSPPGAPHFNGLAEAGVKSVKLHLMKTIGDSKLSFEELSTLLSQIEACVSSRTLCKLSTDPNDINACAFFDWGIGNFTTRAKLFGIKNQLVNTLVTCTANGSILLEKMAVR